MAVISFARGVPAPECLAVDDLADCAKAALARDGQTILSYGPSPGYAPLREWIAARHGVDVSRVFITNGSLQGFVFLAQRLAPGKRVLVEQPTYDRPLKILRELGADTEFLHCDDEGLDPDALEDALRGGEPPAFLYLIPTFQNPSGRTLSEERRRRIVELAAEHDLLVLEDDPYGLVRYDGDAAAVAVRPLGRERRLQLVVLEDDRARPPRRLVRLPGAARAPDRGDGDLHVHHAGAARPGDRARVREPRPLRAESRARRRPARAPAATRCSRHSTASSRR